MELQTGATYVRMDRISNSCRDTLLGCESVDYRTRRE